MELADLVNTETSLVGRVKKVRKVGKELSFLEVSYENKTLQIVAGSSTPNVGDVIDITGKIVCNPAVRTGVPGYELQASHIRVLAQCEPAKAPSTVLEHLESRHLSLRNPAVQSLFKAKAHYMHNARKFLFNEGFMEVNAPHIVDGMVDGYEDIFTVGFFEKKAHLTISNILYQQIALSGDMDRVYTLAPVFRASKSVTRQHLNEIMMLDFHASGWQMDDVILFTERFIASAIATVEDHFPSKVQLPEHVPRVSYDDLIATVAKAGSVTYGDDVSQLCKRYASHLEKNFGEFFWVLDTPHDPKEFFKKSYAFEGKWLNRNAQLRYLPLGQLCDGCEKVTDPEALTMLPEEFSPYVAAARHGLRPNAGMGLGMDRLYMALTGKQDIREVVLFPVSLRS
jgi:nondiscriminating aspartyl-tRNA synthetase